VTRGLSTRPFKPTRPNYSYDFGTVWGYDSELPGAQWIGALAKLPPAAIYVAAGEVSRPPEIINTLPQQHAMFGIVSNLSVGGHVNRRIKQRIHLDASFHRESVNQEEFVSKIAN
jgi:hypothetical protein